MLLYWLIYLLCLALTGSSAKNAHYLRRSLSEVNDTSTSTNNTSVSSDDEARIYHMKKCFGAGCPYTASWLNHVNLYRKAHWWLDSTKMEAASFSVFDAAALKFQVSDPDAYYVHHMSMFEHLIHKKYGFQTAKNRTHTMSTSAFRGECIDKLAISNTTEYMALIPFYGGLPPNVTEDFSQVKSLGQGNSLVDASTKVLQCMATVCSCLNYFGHVVVGVTRQADLNLLEEILATLPEIQKHVDIIQFRMGKPAHLPFHLLSWGQLYVQENNCKNMHDFPLSGGPAGAGTATTTTTNTSLSELVSNGIQSLTNMITSSISRKLFDKSMLATDRKHSRDPYGICTDNLLKRHHGTPHEVVYHRKAAYYNDIHNISKAAFAEYYKLPSTNPVHHSVPHPINFVYYSECDQIVRFDSMSTFHALSAASNDTTFFTGRRREKKMESEPEAYMGNLDNWRNCGESGYSLRWPRDTEVHYDPSKRVRA